MNNHPNNFPEWLKTIRSIKDINNPTKEDYKNMESYLKSSRPYLQPLIKCYPGEPNTRRLGRNLKLLGENGEIPKRIIDKGSNNTQCVFLYASYNRKYIYFIEKNRVALRKVGFLGDIIILQGGFPNTKNGSLVHYRVPYSFKYAAMEDARNSGYRYFLWIDAAVIAQKNINSIFKTIEHHNIFVSNCGLIGTYIKIKDNQIERIPGMEMVGSIEAYNAMNIDLKIIESIPILAGTVMGFDLDSELVKSYMSLLKQYVYDVIPFLGGPGEVSVFSVALYQIPYKIHYSPNPVTSSLRKLQDPDRLFYYNKH